MRIKWTKILVLNEALKYKFRSEFIRKSGSAYNRARKDGYLDEICSHMEKIGNRKMRMIYSYEFSDNSVYVGLTYNIERRNSLHFIDGPVFNYINKTNLIPIRKIISNGYIPSIEASILEQKTIDEYKTNGWVLLNKIKGGGLGGKEIKWTKEKIKIEALKFETRGDFRKNSPKAYDAASRNKILNDVCSHMKYVLNYWTKEKIEIVAKKYNSRWDFQRHSPNEYSVAHKHKWLNELCSHMSYKYKKKREEQSSLSLDS